MEKKTVSTHDALTLAETTAKICKISILNNHLAIVATHVLMPFYWNRRKCTDSNTALYISIYTLFFTEIIL